jgi:tRNA A37 N6-isopentenylltransferase MiaA
LGFADFAENFTPHMKIHASRDSVAAGDDCDDHDRQFIFPNATTIEDAISRIVASGYLASIMGGCATWSATSGFPIAVIAQQWPEIRAVSWQVVDKSTLQTKADEILLHFNYHQQIDPEIVHKILKQAQSKIF